jgi:rRNA maturation endonuclease Nob1
MTGFPFTAIEPNQMGRVTKWDVPIDQWLGLKFQSGNADTFGTALNRMSEDFVWGDEDVTGVDELNTTFGIPGENGLKFSEPTGYNRARLMHERKRKELERMAYLESASHSWASTKAAAGFGAAMVGGLSHPVDLGLAFLPFIGSEKAAAGVAKLGAGAFRQRLARGIITSEEAIARAGLPAARLTASVIDGILSQSIVEIPVAIQKHRDQAVYGLADSAFNILAGGAFAGAVKGLGLALERAGRLWQELDPRVREAMLFDELNAKITGDTPNTRNIVTPDESTIRTTAEERIRAQNPMPEIQPDGTPSVSVPKAIAALPAIPEGHVRLFHGEGGPEGGGTGGAFYTSSAEKAATFGGNVSWVDVPIERAQAGFQKARASGQGGDVFLLEAADIKGAQQLAARIEPPTHVLDGEITAVREQSINDTLTRAKAEHEAKIKGLVDAETARLIAEVKRQSPPSDPETVKRYTFKSTPDDANIKAVEEDAAELEQSVLNLAKTEEERLALETEIKAELKAIEENGMSGEKAIDAMIPCVTARAKS